MKETNKLIAEFMKTSVLYPNEEVRYRQEPDATIWRVHHKLEDLLYHISWDWLMSAVEKINSTGRFEVVIMYGHCHITDGKNELTLSMQEKNTMEAVYKAVVEFIKWLNKNEK